MVLAAAAVAAVVVAAVPPTTSSASLVSTVAALVVAVAPAEKVALVALAVLLVAVLSVYIAMNQQLPLCRTVPLRKVMPVMVAAVVQAVQEAQGVVVEVAVAAPAQVLQAPAHGAALADAAATAAQVRREPTEQPSRLPS